MIAADLASAEGMYYRSTDGRQSFSLVSGGTITSDFFIDGDPIAGESYYRVYSVEDGELGMFSDVRIS